MWHAHDPWTIVAPGAQGHIYLLAIQYPNQWQHVTKRYKCYGTSSNHWENISDVGHRDVMIPAMIVHDDVITWKHFPRYWPFVRGIHRSPVNSPHKSQWRGALMFSLICSWINGWVNNREAGDLRHHRAHYDVIIMNITITTVVWGSITSEPVQRVSFIYTNLRIHVFNIVSIYMS